MMPDKIDELKSADLDAINKIDNLRIRALRPLLPPAILIEELPLDVQAADLIRSQREAIGEILAGEDDRMLAVVGPCSIHDTDAGLEYAQKLKKLADRFSDDLKVVMRVYFEKPRTVVGWKGLINDPNLDGSFRINDGLRLARKFLLDVAQVGLPAGTEFLDTITPQFLADVVSWASIGARTVESQVHRELASGLSMPIGFKNGTGGNVQIAIDAIRSARAEHWFPSVMKQGVTAIFSTSGNEQAHLILRGGARTGPNFDAKSVRAAVAGLEKAGLPPFLMIDCSHGNSEKDFRRQPVVARNVAEQIASGSRNICGLMLESFLVEGRQDLEPGKTLRRGQSVTDGCISIEETETVLGELAKAVQKRRR